jgi:hypothetical protein
MSQIALPFDWPAEDDKSDFLVSSANERAVRHLDSWGNWPVRATLLVGPRKSGKSLLGRIFAARSGGILIDDAVQKREADIFHAWNRAQAGEGPLLVIAHAPPPIWDIRLPDLRSRLLASPIVELDEPDELLAEQLLALLLSKRGLAIAPEAASYITARISRSYVALMQAVDMLDEASLSQRRAITIPFAREVMIKRRIIEA